MEIRNIGAQELARLYRRGLHRDFPPAELRPLWSMRRLLEQGNYAACVAEENGVPQGYALFAQAQGAALLDYFAVEPQLRGRGVGSAFLRALAQKDYGAPYLLIEAESPDSATTPEQLEERRRRIRFYIGCGCRQTGVRSFLFGVEYDILLLPLGETGAVSDDEVSRCLKGLYGVIVSPLVEREDGAFSRVCRVYPRS